VRWENKNTCRWPVLLVIIVPKIFLNGQFYFNLSSKTWSHVFLEHSVFTPPDRPGICRYAPAPSNPDLWLFDLGSGSVGKKLREHHLLPFHNSEWGCYVEGLCNNHDFRPDIALLINDTRYGYNGRLVCDVTLNDPNPDFNARHYSRQNISEAMGVYNTW